ncbi:MAG: LamG domain-containing protein, partial [Bdellovibrionia bacterium]
TNYPYPQTAEDAVYDLYARRVAGIDYIMVATQDTTGAGSSNVELYIDNAGTITKWRDQSAAEANVPRGLYMTSDGKMYYNFQNEGLSREDAIPGANWAPDRTYTLATNAELISNTVYDIEVSEGTSAAEGGSNTVFAATGRGISVLREHSTFASSDSRSYTIAGSGPRPTALGNVVEYGGTSDYISLASATSLTDTFTIEFWFMPNIDWTAGVPCGNGSDKYFFARGATNVDEHIGIRCETTDGKIYLTVRIGGTSYNTVGTTNNFNVGTWYHVAAQLRDDAGTLKGDIWINGVHETANNNMGAAASFAGATSTMYLGCRNNGTPSRFFDGWLDEVRISNATRYTSGVNFALQNANYAFDASTLFLYHFSEQSGATAAPCADGCAAVNGTLVNEAQFTIPLLAGSNRVFTGIAQTTNAGVARVQTVSNTSGTAIGAYSQMSAAQGNAATLSDSTTSLNCSSVDAYQLDTAADTVDTLLGLTSGGVSIKRR